MTTFKAIPQVPVFDDPALTDFCVAIKQRLEVYQGNIGSGSDVVLRKELIDLTKLDEADLNTIGEYGEERNWGIGSTDNFKIGTQVLGGILWDAITVGGEEKHNFTLFDLTNNEPWISAYRNKGILQYYNGGLRTETTLAGTKTTGDAEITGQVTIGGGSPAVGRVLTAVDSSGLAFWQEPENDFWVSIDAGTDLTEFTFEANTTYVLLPGETYEVNKSVIVSNNFVVILGEGAIIKKMAIADGIKITGNNCQIRGPEIDGNSQDWSGIAVYGSSNIVKDVLTHNNNGHGIMQDGQSTTCVYNHITNCISHSNGNIGISLNDAQFSVIADNIIYSNGNEGITIDSSGGGWATGNAVTGNMLYDNATNGIGGIGLDKARCNTITGNYVDNNNHDYSGLKTQNNEDTCYNNIISGNTFINSTRYGIEIATGAGGASHDNKICGNVYLNNTLGDYFICPTCNDNIVIEDTQVSGPASSTDTAIALWNGAGGDTLQNSPILIDSGGHLVVGNHQIRLDNTQNIIWRNAADNAWIVALHVSNLDNIHVGSDGDEVVIGENSSENNPIHIRVNGSNNQQVTRSAYTDGAGKHFLVVP